MKTISIYLTLIFLFFLFFFSCSTGERNRTRKSLTGTNPNKITDDSLLALVQYRTFKHFWDGA